MWGGKPLLGRTAELRSEGAPFDFFNAELAGIEIGRHVTFREPLMCLNSGNSPQLITGDRKTGVGNTDPDHALWVSATPGSRDPKDSPGAGRRAHCACARHFEDGGAHWETRGASGEIAYINAGHLTPHWNMPGMRWQRKNAGTPKKSPILKRRSAREKPNGGPLPSGGEARGPVTQRNQKQGRRKTAKTPAATEVPAASETPAATEVPAAAETPAATDGPPDGKEEMKRRKIRTIPHTKQPNEDSRDESPASPGGGIFQRLREKKGYISVIKMHFGANLPAILQDGGAQGEDGRTDTGTPDSAGALRMRPPFCKMAAPREKTAGRTPGGREISARNPDVCTYPYTKRFTNDHDQRYDLAVIVGKGTIILKVPSHLATLQRFRQRCRSLQRRCLVVVWSLESCHTDSSPATNDAEVPGEVITVIKMCTAHAPAILEDGGAQGEDGRTDGRTPGGP
ncbi:unnamed protein product, partial [Ranitomeya imitator]